MDAHISENWERYTREPGSLLRDMECAFGSNGIAKHFSEWLAEPVKGSDFAEFSRRYALAWHLAYERRSSWEVPEC